MLNKPIVTKPSFTFNTNNNDPFMVSKEENLFLKKWFNSIIEKNKESKG